MEQEILKADKQYRKKLFTAYLIGVAVISLSLYFGLPRFLAHLDKLKLAGRLDLAEISIIVFFACFIVPAGYLIAVGRRIMVAKRFPWPGQKVIHDTKIMDGRKAVNRGRVLFSLGIFTIVILVAGAARTHFIFDKIRNFNFF